MDRTMDKFEFAGFEPGFDVKSTISRSLEMVLGIAPSDSNHTARLSRTREGFKGFLKLASLQGTFIAEASGDNPIETVNRLREKVSEQIRRWKRDCLSR